MKQVSLNDKGEIKISDNKGKNVTFKRNKKKITNKELNGQYQIDSYDILKIMSLLYDKQIVNEFGLVTEDNASLIYNANEINKKNIEELKRVKETLNKKTHALRELKYKVRDNNKRFFKKKISLE